MFESPEFWVACAFVVFVGVLIYYEVPGTLTRALDARGKAIKHELDQARTLREEAYAALTSWKAKQAEAAARTEQVLADARAEAKALATQAQAELEAAIARRTDQALDRIAQAEQKASAEVRAAAVDAAVAAARAVIAQNLTADDQVALIDKAIGDTARRLH